MAARQCGSSSGLVPGTEDLLGFRNLIIQPGKMEFHFSGSASAQNFNARQTASLHSALANGVAYELRGVRGVEGYS